MNEEELRKVFEKIMQGTASKQETADFLKSLNVLLKEFKEELKK